MSIGDIVVLGIVALAVVQAVIRVRKKKTTCGCGCSDCTAACDKAGRKA